MIVEKNLNGWLIISCIIKNNLVTKKYQGYKLKQAIKLFKDEQF